VRESERSCGDGGDGGGVLLVCWMRGLSYDVFGGGGGSENQILAQGFRFVG